jgi:uncharacterized protein (TIGR04255 family)
MIQRPESIFREPDRVRDLPDFMAPPLVEVILSIQFAALGNLKSAHIGLLWERLRSDYPDVTEQAPLQAVFETFGIPNPTPMMQIQAFFTPQLPRYWFERSDSPNLLQFQQDRIIHNWRQQPENSHIYPRYESVKAAFEDEIQLIERWLSDESIGELRPNQCEVTYTNIISLPEEEAVHGSIDRITPLWTGKFSEEPPNKLERTRIEMTFLFSHDEKPTGRVYVNFQPAFRPNDGGRVVKLDITARGRPQGESVADALAFLDLEREQVVRTFGAVTTTEMHKLWGRTDGPR